jgi:hypothetical protein
LTFLWFQVGYLRAIDDYPMNPIFKSSPTSITPEILFALEKQFFRISGRSMPEDSDGFYRPVKTWLTTNLEGSKFSGFFDVKLEYYNTGSFIRLMEVFNVLADLNKGGCQISVRWYYEAEDPDSKDDGESFKDVVKLPFEVIQI